MKKLIILMMGLFLIGTLTSVSADGWNYDYCEDTPKICTLTVRQIVLNPDYPYNITEANYIYHTKCARYRLCEKIVDKPKPKPKPTPLIDDDPVPTKKTHSSRFVTQWALVDGECVKADVLTVPYTAPSNSVTNVPHVVLKTFADGSRRVSQIREGKFGIVIDMETRKVIKEPNCLDPNKGFMDWNWFVK